MAAFTVLGFMLVSPGIARAADSEEPERLIRQGVELRRNGHDDRAFSYLQRAYDIAPTPRSAAQLGLVEFALGRWDAAQAHLSEALSGTRDPWVSGNRKVLEKSLVTTRSHLGKLLIDGAPTDATVSVNEGQPTKLAPDGVLWLAPGESTVTVQAPDHDRARSQQTMAAGAEQHWQVRMPAREHPREVAAAPPAAGATVPPPVGSPAAPGAAEATGDSAGPHGSPAADGAAAEGAPSPRALRIAGIAVAGVGVAALVAGVVVKVQANTEANVVEAAGQKAGQGLAGSYPSSNDNWQTLDRLGVGLLIGGGVALAGGAVLYFLNRDKAGAGAEKGATTATITSSLSVALAPDVAGGGNLWLAGSF